VSLRAGLDKCGKSRPQRDPITGPSSPQAVAILTEIHRPTKNFFYSFNLWSWVRCLLVSGCCPSPYVTLCALHVVPAVQELAEQTIISLVGFSKGIRLEYL
jgi:hypothetical protein